jgi:hypothetical protein
MATSTSSRCGSACRRARLARARRGSEYGELLSQRGFRSGVLAASNPWLVRSDRPSFIVAPNRNITKMEIDGAAGGLTIGPSGSSSIAPPKP